MMKTITPSIQSPAHTHCRIRLVSVLLAVLLLLPALSIPAYAARDPAVYDYTPGAQGIGTPSGRIDTSHLAEGYVLARYTGSAPRAVLHLQRLGTGRLYDCYLVPGEDWTAVPVQQGDGLYAMRLYEEDRDGLLRLVVETREAVDIEDPLLPFLYPNAIIPFTDAGPAAQLAEDLCRDMDTDPEKISAIFEYLVANVTYDDMLAASDRTGYVTDVDATIENGTGICVDYAGAMCAMLRLQGIPARMVLGEMADGGLHAWVSVYSDQAGTAGGMVLEAGRWTRLDPTFAATDRNNAQLVQALSEWTGDYDGWFGV